MLSVKVINKFNKLLQFVRTNINAQKVNFTEIEVSFFDGLGVVSLLILNRKKAE